jgi:Na+/phosphate symporter
MSAQPALKEHAADFDPLLTKLIAGTGAARDGFNRHSRTSMEELKTLTQTATQEIIAERKNLQEQMARVSAAQQQNLLRIFKIFTRLQDIAHNLISLADPIQKKIKDGVLFSDKAVSQTNYLFDTQAGLLRSVRDIVNTNNEFLKRYTETEARNLIQACSNFATEHETRMIEGVCLPQAAPLFLTILDNMRMMGQHEVEIVQLLA